MNASCFFIKRFNALDRAQVAIMIGIQGGTLYRRQQIR
jgi:hypothetical protein